MNFILRFRSVACTTSLNQYFDLFCILTCFTVCVNYSYCLKENKSVDDNLFLRNCEVYGPGLQANFTVPVRYFFIHFQNLDNESHAFDPQKLSIQVAGLKQKCHIWYQLLHIKHGLFVARYRLYETCFGVKIEIIYDNQLVADAPYTVKGLLFHEQCYCPKPMSEWMSALECPSSYPQIQEDLKKFDVIDMSQVIKEALARFNHPSSYSICHYSVVSNQVYRKCFGQYVGFSMFMDEILLSLTRKMYLPDMELLVNLGDWPLEQRTFEQNPIPIFSWCGSESTRDIVMPTYDITEATLEMMGRVMVDILSVMGNSGPLWEEKFNMAFWRGRDSSRERLDLIKIARQYPDLINASLTNFFFFRKEEEEYGPKTEYISIFDFFKYKYQINIDGTVAAYRMPYLLAGGSLVLKQESEFYEHFYAELEPMIHYVPIQRNLSDLVDWLQWSLSHDSEAKEMAESARQFALSRLMPKDILCYYAVLFKEYAKRLKSKNKIHDEMENVKQPLQKNCFCSELAETNSLLKEEL